MQPVPGAGVTHPKNALYDMVYEPVTVAWFGKLSQSRRRAALLEQAPQHDLLRNLNELNKILHELVDACLDELRDRLDGMLAVVRENLDHVLWEGPLVPALNADYSQVEAAFRHKVKRNVSMGAVEIVICVEAGTAFCRDRLDLRGERLSRTLKKSGQLAGSLALLHDVQEQHRLQVLTGEHGYLKYPDVTFEDVIVHGRYRIPPEMFVVLGSGDDLRLRFVSTRVHPGPFDSPVRRCPAFSSGIGFLNDALWRLVVDIFRLSGRFH